MEQRPNLQLLRRDVLDHLGYVVGEFARSPKDLTFGMRFVTQNGAKTTVELAFLVDEAFLNVSQTPYRAGHYDIDNGGKLYIEMERILMGAGLKPTAFPHIPHDYGQNNKAA